MPEMAICSLSPASFLNSMPTSLAISDNAVAKKTPPYSKPSSLYNPLDFVGRPSLTHCVFQWKSNRFPMEIKSFSNGN
jgi:hypothetical protein